MWETLRTICGMSKPDLHWLKLPVKTIGKAHSYRKRTLIMLTLTTTFFRLSLLSKTRKHQFINPISTGSIIIRWSTGLNWYIELVSLNAAITV
jgi:predicted transcriptional regulator